MSNKLLKPKNIPLTPGVYMFKSAGGKILYVGKAKNLRVRLSSYFQNRAAITPAKIKMLSEARSVALKEAVSEIDALILESSLIKKYRPKYNILLRDDKNYFFVKFGSGEFPRISITHQPSLRTSDVRNESAIGPFTDGAALKSALKTIRRAFPYCTCKEKHLRHCVSHQIGNCPGYCCLRNSPNRSTSDIEQIKRDQYRQYQKNIRAIKDVLSGKKKIVLKRLEKEMRASSVNQKYEEADILRKKIRALEKIFEHKGAIKAEIEIDAQKALNYLKTLLKLNRVPKRIEVYDISNIQGSSAVGAMVVFTDGNPDKSEYRKFAIKTVTGANDPEMMREVVSRRLKNSWKLPDLIIVDGGITQLNAVKKAAKIPVIGFAKKSDTLVFSEQKSIKLEEFPLRLRNLLKYAISEAHRFAVSYHRAKRKTHHLSGDTASK